MIEYRVNDNSIIMNKFGKRSFEDDNLRMNLESLITTIAKRKPETVKGRFLLKASIKTSMGPTLKLDLSAYKDF
jgi:large subunit ribosomal protein L1